MTDLTPETRIRKAVAVVREQRDPDGEYAGCDAEPESAIEAFLQQELHRLQRAVMGEPDPTKEET